jgi:hypothetical protein
MGMLLLWLTLEGNELRKQDNMRLEKKMPINSVKSPLSLG